MEQLKKAIRVNRIGQTITDQFQVDGDVNVPDAKNDMARIVFSVGEVKVDDIKRMENYARVTGKILYQILYAEDGEERKLSALQGKLPFEEMVYVEEEPKGPLFVKDTGIELTAGMIHSRKLTIKAMVELLLGSEGAKEELLTTDVSDEEHLYKKYKTRDLLKLNTVKRDTYRIKEEMKIPGTKENIGTLLWTEVASRKLDTRLSADALEIRGELQVFCFYESLEGKMDWVEQMVPYEGKIECYGADDSMYHHLHTELMDENVDVRMDEDGEMRIFGIEATLEIRLAVYEEEQVELLEDLYSLHKVCSPQIESIQCESLVMQNHSKCKVMERLSLPEIKDDILQICHCSGYLQTEHTEIVENGICVEGILNICFLYVKADDKIPFDVWQGMIPFTHIIESNDIAENMRYDISGALEQINIGLLGNDEVEVKAVLSFHIFLRCTEDIPNIAEIETQPFCMEDMENAPGIVGYIVKEGDELWNLAKQYSTTMDGIMEVNEMSSPEVKPGQKILIFRENMSIL